MNASEPRPSRILLYSYDKVLLYTRRRAIEVDGWTVDIASSPKTFKDYVATRLDGCGLIILGSSVSAAEQKSIKSAAKDWKVKVYAITSLIDLKALADKVVGLMAR